MIEFLASSLFFIFAAFFLVRHYFVKPSMTFKATLYMWLILLAGMAGICQGIYSAFLYIWNSL